MQFQELSQLLDLLDADPFDNDAVEEYVRKLPAV